MPKERSFYTAEDEIFGQWIASGKYSKKVIDILAKNPDMTVEAFKKWVVETIISARVHYMLAEGRQISPGFMSFWDKEIYESMRRSLSKNSTLVSSVYGTNLLALTAEHIVDWHALSRDPNLTREAYFDEGMRLSGARVTKKIIKDTLVKGMVEKGVTFFFKSQSLFRLSLQSILAEVVVSYFGQDIKSFYNRFMHQGVMRLTEFMAQGEWDALESARYEAWMKEASVKPHVSPSILSTMPASAHTSLAMAVVPPIATNVPNVTTAPPSLSSSERMVLAALLRVNPNVASMRADLHGLALGRDAQPFTGTSHFNQSPSDVAPHRWIQFQNWFLHTGSSHVHLDNHSGRMTFRIQTSNPALMTALVGWEGLKYIHRTLYPTLTEQLKVIDGQLEQYSRFAQGQGARYRIFTDADRELAKVQSYAQRALAQLDDGPEHADEKRTLRRLLFVAKHDKTALTHPQHHTAQIMENVQHFSAELFRKFSNDALTCASPGVTQHAYDILRELQTFFPENRTELLWLQSLIEQKSGDFSAAIPLVKQFQSGVNQQIWELEQQLDRLHLDNPYLRTLLYSEQYHPEMIEQVAQYKALTDLVQQQRLMLSESTLLEKQLLFQQAEKTHAATDIAKLGSFLETQCRTLSHWFEAGKMMDQVGEKNMAERFLRQPGYTGCKEQVEYLAQFYTRQARFDEAGELLATYFPQSQDAIATECLILHYVKHQDVTKLIDVLNRVPEQQTHHRYYLAMAHLMQSTANSGDPAVFRAHYELGTKIAHQYFSEVAAQEKLGSEMQEQTLQLKGVLAAVALQLDDKKLGIQLTNEYLNAAEKCGKNIHAAKELHSLAASHFDRKYTTESAAFIERAKASDPTNVDVCDFYDNLNGYIEQRTNAFFVQVGSFIIINGLSYVIQNEWIRDKKQLQVVQGVMVGLQVSSQIASHYIHAAVEKHLSQLPNAPVATSSYAQVFGQWLSHFHLGSTLLDCAYRARLLSRDKITQADLKTIIKLGRTVGDVGGILQFVGSGISAQHIFQDSQVALSALGATTCLLRIINRFTYEYARENQLPLPENILSYAAEDIMNIATSWPASIAIGAAGIYLEYPEQCRMLLSQIPFAPQVKDVVLKIATSFWETIKAFWALGPVAQGVIIVGGAVLICYTASKVKEHFDYKEIDALQHNAHAALTNDDLVTVRLKIEQLQNMKMDLAHQVSRDRMTCMLHEKERDWQKLFAFSEEKLSMHQNDPYFLYYRAQASRMQNLSTATQDFEAVLTHAKPEEITLRSSSLLALGQIHPNNPAYYQQLFELINTVKQEVGGIDKCYLNLREQCKKLIQYNIYQCLQHGDQDQSNLLREQCTRYLEQAPEDVDIYLSRAQLRQCTQQDARHLSEHAIQDIELALKHAKTDDDRYKVRTLQTQLYAHHGELHLASNALSALQALKVSPEQTQAVAALSLSVDKMLCAYHEREQHWGQLRSLADEKLSIHHNNPYFLYYRAQASRMLDQSVDAAQDFEAVLTHAKPEEHALRANSLLYLGQMYPENPLHYQRLFDLVKNAREQAKDGDEHYYSLCQQLKGLLLHNIAQCLQHENVNQNALLRAQCATYLEHISGDVDIYLFRAQLHQHRQSKDLQHLNEDSIQDMESALGAAKTDDDRYKVYTLQAQLYAHYGKWQHALQALSLLKTLKGSEGQCQNTATLSVSIQEAMQSAYQAICGQIDKWFKDISDTYADMDDDCDLDIRLLENAIQSLQGSGHDHLTQSDMVSGFPDESRLHLKQYVDEQAQKQLTLLREKEQRIWSAVTRRVAVSSAGIFASQCISSFFNQIHGGRREDVQRKQIELEFYSKAKPFVGFF